MYIRALFHAFTMCSLVAGTEAAILGVDIPVRAVAPREILGLNVWKLYDAVKDFLGTGNAYDPSTPDKCNLFVRTSKGGNCQTFVNCEQNDGWGQDMGPWNVCYLNGRQFFHHDLLGDFSVTFTQAGGVNSDQDGLHHPVYQFAALNNWEPLNVEDVLAKQSESNSGSGNLCTRDNDFEILGYGCGLPQLQRAATSAFGISLVNPDSDKSGFTPGWCTAHVIQYQRNEYGNGDKYAFTIQIFDGAGDQIGSVQKQEVDDAGGLAVYSKLPYALTLKVGAGDEDPVSFSYGAATWLCTGDKDKEGDHHCNLGEGDAHGFENGDREGDMGFTC
ncbi:hypothetical protein F4859DRAFT_494028 [Xylaria cf. heliscus]|nr:hypothetical protein F4859DRAFT_494028 [Xylaria cf. heliscus]